MKLTELSRLAHDAGLALVQRSEHHYQLTDPQGAALVDVWPGTNRFRRHNAPEGKKAAQGSEAAAVESAVWMLPKPLPPIEEKPAAINGKAAKPMPDPVNHPAHYTAGKLEVIDAIEGLQLGFHAGNVVKYVARYRLKGGIEDLRKAVWYLQRLIEAESKT